MIKSASSKQRVAQNQLSTLLANGRSTDGNAYSIQALAEVIHVSDQALRNLLNGRTVSPRLETARSICRLYGITLDYFSLESEPTCQTHLLHKQQHASPILRAIDEQSRQLSPTATESLIRIAIWIRAKGVQDNQRPKSTI